MAAAPKAARAPRTITRDEGVSRMPDRDPTQDQDRIVPAEERDPNKIYSRDGREINGLRFTGDEDKFDLNHMGIVPPPGWTYEWKTKTIKNWEWRDHQVELYQNGWTPVPAERHDGLVMPRGHDGPIERGGMVLMERPARLTQMARQIEKRKADDPVQQSRSMAGLMSRAVPGVSPDSMDFSVNEAQRFTGVKVSRQALTPDTNYKYQLDE